jgi:hypothetical protein
MTQLVNQPTAAPSRKVKAASVGGIVLGVPVAQPLASVTMGILKAVTPGLFETLNSVDGFQSGLASLFAVLIAVGAAYAVKDKV